MYDEVEANHLLYTQWLFLKVGLPGMKILQTNKNRKDEKRSKVFKQCLYDALTHI